jgi:hypothetical protein
MTSTEIVFVLPGRSEEELARVEKLDVDRDWRFFEDGVAAWIVQTYLRLRDFGVSVQLANAFSRNGINIAHVATLAKMDRPQGCFVVGVRADYPAVRWCQFHIVQNQTQIGSRSIWLPHWPQPGLIPRDPARGDRVERVGYFGRPVNHYSRIFRRASGYFRVRDAVNEICNELGLDLVERGTNEWNNFSDVDVVLGLRDFGNRTYDTKPPTKLINAWLAGSIFIAGNDSAFFQIGKANTDWLCVKSAEQLKYNLIKLMQNEIYRYQLRTKGLLQTEKFNIDSILSRWAICINELNK